MPRSELNRLLASVSNETGVTVRPEGETTRAVDPTVVTSVVEGTVTVMLPFITLLATRLFAREPAAQVAVESPERSSAQGAGHTAVPATPIAEPTILVATQSPEERERLLAIAWNAALVG